MHVYFFLFFLIYLSCHTTQTPQTEKAQSEKHCRRRSASSGHKTRRGIEGEKPGRRRYREVLLPERSLIQEKSSERPSPKSRRSVPRYPPSSKRYVRNVPKNSSSPRRKKSSSSLPKKKPKREIKNRYEKKKIKQEFGRVGSWGRWRWRCVWKF